jgi:hypothetical protein
MGRAKDMGAIHPSEVKRMLLLGMLLFSCLLLCVRLLWLLS